MSKIFELFGYRLDCWNKEAAQNLAKAWCPFMDAECDGGGNRYLSALTIKEHSRLKGFFPGKDVVQCGVCSLTIREGEQPWIVCPRRLLSLKNTHSYNSTHQEPIKQQLGYYAQLEPGKIYRAWSEVKMKLEGKNDEEEAKSFDYSFDYIITGSSKKRISDIATILKEKESFVRKYAESNGYTIALRDREFWVDDFPADPIVIVEIMTSSTSGGDKKRRTQIAMACEDAILAPEKHKGPGINYRQVWARMASQLIVKSQVGMAWGGKTFWLVQDLLAQYISHSTALDLYRYVTTHSDEVNVLAFGYGDISSERNKPLSQLENSTFFAGPITNSSIHGKAGGFVDIVKIGAPPEKEHLWRSLFKKSPCGSIKIQNKS